MRMSKLLVRLRWQKSATKCIAVNAGAASGFKRETSTTNGALRDVTQWQKSSSLKLLSSSNHVPSSKPCFPCHRHHPCLPHMMWGFFLSITYMQSKVKTVLIESCKGLEWFQNFLSVDTIGHSEGEIYNVTPPFSGFRARHFAGSQAQGAHRPSSAECSMSQNLLQCDYIAPIHHEMAWNVCRRMWVA